VKSWIL